LSGTLGSSTAGYWCYMPEQRGETPPWAMSGRSRERDPVDSLRHCRRSRAVKTACWKGSVSRAGTRQAAQRWHQCVAAVWLSRCGTMHSPSPCAQEEALGLAGTRQESLKGGRAKLLPSWHALARGALPCNSRAASQACIFLRNAGGDTSWCPARQNPYLAPSPCPDLLRCLPSLLSPGSHLFFVGRLSIVAPRTIVSVPAPGPRIQTRT
jgi:hypothetical protein